MHRAWVTRSHWVTEFAASEIYGHLQSHRLDVTHTVLSFLKLSNLWNLEIQAGSGYGDLWICVDINDHLTVGGSTGSCGNVANVLEKDASALSMRRGFEVWDFRKVAFAPGDTRMDPFHLGGAMKLQKLTACGCGSLKLSAVFYAYPFLPLKIKPLSWTTMT